MDKEIIIMEIKYAVELLSTAEEKTQKLIKEHPEDRHAAIRAGVYEGTCEMVLDVLTKIIESQK